MPAVTTDRQCGIARRLMHSPRKPQRRIVPVRRSLTAIAGIAAACVFLLTAPRAFRKTQQQHEIMFGQVRCRRLMR